MYTHGLEQIYAFETINPLTVRTVAVQAEAVANTNKLFNINTIQLPLFPEGIASLRLKEPVHFLRLSPFALKGLLTRQIKTIEEACHLLQSDATSYKGLGQGHIEEIQEKIASLLGPRPFAVSETVDWGSFLRISLHDQEPKLRTAFLARFDLSHLFPLTSSDHQELCRWNQEQIFNAFEKTKRAILHEHGPFIEKTLRAIMKSYVVPWLRFRHGFAPLAEIQMHLYQIAEQKPQFWPVLEFLREVIGELPLIEAAPGVLADTHETAKGYATIEKCAASYFYQPFVWYPLDKLATFIRCEQARLGNGYPDGFIEKVLKTCPHLQLFHQNSHDLLVQQRQN